MGFPTGANSFPEELTTVKKGDINEDVTESPTAGFEINSS